MALKNRCARIEQSLLFNLFKNLIKSNAIKIRVVYPGKKPIFLHACAAWSELPSTITNMIKRAARQVLREREII